MSGAEEAVPAAEKNAPQQQGGDGEGGMLRVVVEGCCHGELDQIYASIGRLEQASGKKVDLLICCGDFQAVRNKEDLATMNVPSKYLTMASFHRYYSGEAVVPVLTLFIGGNHEASNHLQELYYGGWVAPNIYYLGAAGVVRVGGVRIAGLSGIFNGRHYKRGHHEAPPYSSDTIRSVYHVRELEVFKLAQLREAPLDVMLSHDWPRGVYHHGDLQRLLRAKPFFRHECETNTLGSPPAEYLLEQLKPSFWFSGHLHCKFAAVVRHQDDQAKTTRFLALDKCLPNRDFLQLVEIPRPADARGQQAVRLEHDVEWLAIVKATHELLSRSDRVVPLPTEVRLVTPEDKAWVRARLEAACTERGQDPATHALEIPPESFVRTAPVYEPTGPRPPVGGSQTLQGSPQTDALLALLELNHRVTIPYQPGAGAAKAAADEAPVDGFGFYLDHGDGLAPVDGAASGGGADPNAIDIDDLDEGEGGDDGDADGDGGNGQEAEEGGDTIVYEGTAAAAPAKARSRLVLPPPSAP